ncbi:hypothetical protein KP509_11G016600 [Ceratopteris richardii]|uniref:Uncharacterized protein n=1 Tax=Ceratopteris richardii TaxID=49495 RepID=A0A8T2TMP2_CERRI|nr:hypothetical protein KP509_11G016600 [Ceratopteris richardii]
MQNRCCVLWCSCIPVGQIANVVDEGHTTCAEGCCVCSAIQAGAGLGCLYTCYNRKRTRRMFNLPAEPCNDFLHRLVLPSLLDHSGLPRVKESWCRSVERISKSRCSKSCPIRSTNGEVLT